MDQAQQLRNAIKLKNQKKEQTARVITITSGKGGVGKSNCAVNLAIGLRIAGKRVIVFDADFGLPNVEVMFGSIPKFNLTDLIYNGKEIQEIITEGPLGVGFISGGSGIVGLNTLYKEQVIYLTHCMAQLNDMADFIIVDTGAGISDQVLEFVVASPEVILVTTPDPSSLTDSYSLLKALYHNPKFNPETTKIQVLANKATSVEDGKAVYEKLSSVVTKFLRGEVHYLGMIPQDEALERSVRQQKTVTLNEPNAKSTKAFEMITKRIIEREDYTEMENSKGFLHMVSNLLNRKD